MSRVVPRVLLAAALALAGPAARPAAASLVCAEHISFGRLCVQNDPNEPVTCEQTGMLATCDIVYDDPCDRLALCYVCPTGDPCPPPAARS